MASFKITQIPVLTDNYVYTLTCTKTHKTAVIDAPSAAPITMQYKKIDYVLNTHHHGDHTGGNIALKQHYACKIIGSAYDQERIPGIDHPLKEGDSFKLGQLHVEVLFLPGHTRGHIGFYLPRIHTLFCGDVLFAGGCGRVFEGTHQHMFESLQKIKNLPPQTVLYPTHEYTVQNYAFATHMYPQNTLLKKAYQKAQQLRQKGMPTVPTSLKEELETNIFLNAKDVNAFSTLRNAKDAF